MPQQLIYTSAPRGITAGRSGYCTVARSAGMREALATRLEQLSYYHHQSLTGGVERRIHAFRFFDVRGTRYFALSRIQDAGLDFTKRTNFLAHHLVFTQQEIAAFGSPPLLFLYWDGWQSSWDGEPELLTMEDWGNLNTIKCFESDPTRQYETAPARHWKQVTGAHVNAFGLLDRRDPVWLAVDGLDEEDILHLFSESLRMLELRFGDVSLHSKVWTTTFTTNLQEQDSPDDFKWKCVDDYSSAPNRKVTVGAAIALQQIASSNGSPEEVYFATNGPFPAKIVQELENQRIPEGRECQLHVEARGSPSLKIQWFLNNAPLAKEHGSDCTIPQLKSGMEHAYEVHVSNDYGSDKKKASIIVDRVEVRPQNEGERQLPVSSTIAQKCAICNLIAQTVAPKPSAAWPSKEECIQELDSRPDWDDSQSSDIEKLFYYCSESAEQELMPKLATRCLKQLGWRFRLRLGYRRKPLTTVVYATTIVCLSAWLAFALGWPLLRQRFWPQTQLNFTFVNAADAEVFSVNGVVPTNGLQFVLYFGPLSKTNGALSVGSERSKTGTFSITPGTVGNSLSIQLDMAPNRTFYAELFQNRDGNKWEEYRFTLSKSPLSSRREIAQSPSKQPEVSATRVHKSTNSLITPKPNAKNVPDVPVDGVVTVSGYLPAAFIAAPNKKK